MSSRKKMPQVKPDSFYSVEAYYAEGAPVGRSEHVLGRFVERERRELRGLAERGYKVQFDIRDEGITTADLALLAKVKGYTVKIGDDEVSLLQFLADNEDPAGLAALLSSCEMPIRVGIGGGWSDEIRIVRREKVTAPNGDNEWIVCVCGNNPEYCGFALCSSTGALACDEHAQSSPDCDEEHALCLICGRYFSLLSLEVLGRLISREDAQRRLKAEFARWRKAQGLSIEEPGIHCDDTGISEEQRCWLRSYCDRWKYSHYLFDGSDGLRKAPQRRD